MTSVQNNRWKKIFLFIIIFCFMLPISFLTASADMAPKGILSVKIESIEKSDYILGFLTDTVDTDGTVGRYVIIDSDYVNEVKKENADYTKAAKLAKLYENADIPSGWYLLQYLGGYYMDVDAIDYEISYDPPTTELKVIIYDEINDKTYVSNTIQSYAVSSYFTCSKVDETSFEFVKSYDYSKEILGFVLRVVATLAIELLLALCFKFDKKSFLIITITNVVTQIGLNLFLNLSISFLIFAELAVTFAEALIYHFFCKRKDGSKKDIIPYAVLANLCSFVAGLILYIFI